MIDGTLAVDAHCHIGDFKVEKNGIRCFTAEDLIGRMDQNGIDKAVVCHLISPIWERAELRAGNDLVLEAVKKHPDRLVGLCVLNPKHGSFAVEEAHRCLMAGMRGIKVHPVLHGNYPIDGALMDPLMQMARDAGVPVVTHSDFDARCCTPYQVAHLAARFPEVTVVMLHMGMDTDLVAHTPEIAEPYPNLILDTSCTPDLPYPIYVNSARKVGASRMVFGSDGPVCSVEANLAKLSVAERTYGLSKEDSAMILGGTAARLFKIC